MKSPKSSFSDFKTGKLYFLIIITLLIAGCNKEKPKVTTDPVKNITTNSATSGGKVLDDGNADVSVRGVCWSTDQSPTVNNSKTMDGSGIGSFTSNITQLTPNTQYYVKAYATNEKGTGYGNEVSFTTNPLLLASVTTSPVTNVTTNSAECGGNVTDDGGAEVTARGVCWNTLPNPTTSNFKTVNGSGLGAFTSSLTGLEPGNTYYVKAYATNSVGTAYGNEINFPTDIQCPSATTDQPSDSDVGLSTAILKGIVNPNGLETTVTFEYGTTTSYGNVVTARQSPITGNSDTYVDANVSNLLENTTYHYRVKAVNALCSRYGFDISFKTKQCPSVTTEQATNIGLTSVTLNGTVNANGESTTVTFEYGTSTSYGNTITATQSPVTGTSNTSVEATVTNLSASTTGNTYHYRVKVQNAYCTKYGLDETFRTEPTQVNDASGNTYHVIQIGTQFWMRENLKTTKYNNGTDIVNETGSWYNLITPAYCWIWNDDTYKNPYGALYNWYAVNTGILCPTGWQVPTDTDWEILINYVGGESIAGGKLKEVGTAHWESPNTGAENDPYNFTALPGGFRTIPIIGTGFMYFGQRGIYWSSTPTDDQNNAYSRSMIYNGEGVTRGSSIKWQGLSVRCVKPLNK